MIKKNSNPRWFSLKLMMVGIAFAVVVFACSRPNDESHAGNDVIKVEGYSLNIDPDSIHMSTAWNPDDNTVKFVVTLGKEYNTTLKVFNSKGNLLQTLMKGTYDRGAYIVPWNTLDGQKIPDDEYSYQLEAGDKEIFGMLSTDIKSQVKKSPIHEDVFTVVEKMPEFGGDKNALFNYLANNIVYPKKAIENGTTGRVFVNFIVNTDGSVSDVKVLRGIGDGCDEEAVRVIKNMPKWKPGEQHGKKVRVSYNLPIKFVLDGEQADSVFTVVEEMPEFPGGKGQFMKYLAENIKYPEQAKKNKVEGRVFVSFVVEKDGSISGVKILRGIGSGCDAEALRVVKNMPNWKPGKQRGQYVRVAYNLPIRFKLD